MSSASTSWTNTVVLGAEGTYTPITAPGNRNPFPSEQPGGVSDTVLGNAPIETALPADTRYEPFNILDSESAETEELRAQEAFTELLHLAETDRTGTDEWYQKLHAVIASPFLAQDYAQHSDNDVLTSPFTPHITLDELRDDIAAAGPRAVERQIDILKRHSTANPEVAERLSEQVGKTYFVHERVGKLTVVRNAIVPEAGADVPYVKGLTMANVSEQVNDALTHIGERGLFGLDKEGDEGGVKGAKEILTLPGMRQVRKLKGDDVPGGHETALLTDGGVPEIGLVRSIMPGRETELLDNTLTIQERDKEAFCEAFNQAGIIGAISLRALVGGTSVIDAVGIRNWITDVNDPSLVAKVAAKTFQAAHPVFKATKTRELLLRAEAPLLTHLKNRSLESNNVKVGS